jgi:hypothetical protein
LLKGELAQLAPALRVPPVPFAGLYLSQLAAAADALGWCMRDV